MSLLSSFLIGLPGGSRALTPLTVVSDAARRDALPADNGAPRWLASPFATAALALLAAGELFGDKMPSAPDRTVPAGLLARIVSGGISGAALAPRRNARLGAVLGASAAVAAAFGAFALRRRSIERFGQTPTGLVEDALTLGLASAVVRSA